MDLKRDRDIIRTALRQSGDALKAAYPVFREIKEFVLMAVQNNGLALKHASGMMKRNQRVVLAAVKNNGLALEHADDTLKKNRKIVLNAIENNARAIEFATILKDSKDFILIALKINPYVFKYLSAELKNDHDVQKALKTSERAWNNIA